nr:hypothetical protein [Tanacetum cinerariifolium]
MVVYSLFTIKVKLEPVLATSISTVGKNEAATVGKNTMVYVNAVGYATMNVNTKGPVSFSKLVFDESSRKKVNFHTLVALTGNGSDVAISLESLSSFSEDGLSDIPSKLGTPLILDSYTYVMCTKSWGRTSYARAMIEFRAHVELKDTIVVDVLKLVGKGFLYALKIFSMSVNLLGVQLASKEIDIGLDGGHDKPLRLADMILYSWDGGLDVCVDLTGSSPLKQTEMADFASERAVIDAAYNVSLAQDIGARAAVYIFNRIGFAVAKGLEWAVRGWNNAMSGVGDGNRIPTGARHDGLVGKIGPDDGLVHKQWAWRSPGKGIGVSVKLQSKDVLINSVQVVDASLVITESSRIESENNSSENTLSKSVNETQMQMKEVKVDMGKALDAGLVVTESSGTESDKQDTSSRLGNGITYAMDADIRPVYDQVPFVEGKPVLQPPRSQSVVRQPNVFKFERPNFSKPRFASQVDVNNVLSKPFTPHYLPKVREYVLAKPHHVIAPGSSRNSSKESYGSNDMAHKYYLKKAKKKTQDKNRNLKPREMPYARTHHTPNACRTKPRSNNQTSRN